MEVVLHITSRAERHGTGAAVKDRSRQSTWRDSSGVVPRDLASPKKLVIEILDRRRLFLKY